MHQKVLALASAGEHPLIDLDSTVLVQLVIFFLLTAVASRFLFRPYLRMRKERAAGIEGARAEAERLAAEADARLADYESTLAAARQRGEDERRKVRTEAAAHEREVTDRARHDAQTAFGDAVKEVSDQAATARATLMPRASVLAQQVASKLLGREVA